MKNLSGASRISSLLSMLNKPVLKSTSSLHSIPDNLTIKSKRTSTKTSPLKKSKPIGRNYFPLFTDKVRHDKSNSKEAKRDSSSKTIEIKEEAKTPSFFSTQPFGTSNKTIKKVSGNGKMGNNLMRSNSTKKDSPPKNKAPQTKHQETQTDPDSLFSLLVFTQLNIG